MFSTIPNFLFTFKLSSANAFNLERSKILWYSKELTLYKTIPGFEALQKTSFENNTGKEENAC